MSNMDHSAFSGGVMEVPYKDGNHYPFRVEIIEAPNGRFLLPLEQERTEAGTGLVRALWFDHEVYLWMNHRHYRLRPWKCHIVGELFREQYLRAKEKDHCAEVSCVWELNVISSEETEILPPAPLPLHLAGTPAYHLDHPSLH